MTENKRFSEMVINAVYAKKIQTKRILFDNWYASAENLKLVHRLDLYLFHNTEKQPNGEFEQRRWLGIHLDQTDWTAERLQNGVRVKLKEVPFKVQLFKVVATNGDIDWVITNCPDETLTSQAAQDSSDVRWQIEELHRGLKQLTGTEKCQCRKGLSQRNHIACCYHAWLSLKVKAKVLGKTLYRVKDDLLSDYLRAEVATLRRIHAFIPV
jgi:hypothetical protein